jgi:hypothetical protein
MKNITNLKYKNSNVKISELKYKINFWFKNINYDIIINNNNHQTGIPTIP